MLDDKIMSYMASRNSDLIPILAFYLVIAMLHTNFLLL